MSIVVDVLQYGTGSHPTTSEAANFYATDLLTDGIIGTLTNTSGVAPTTGGWAVNAQGTPDKTVAVGSGVAYVTATPTSQGSQRLRVKSNATQNVTLNDNVSGSTKYDWIYISLDANHAANPDTAADDVASIVVSRATNNTSDDGTPPTYGRNLAVVTVANGFTSITNGNIADKRVQTGIGSGAWTSWTPTLTVITVGNGTLDCRYSQLGKTIICKFSLTIGSSTIVGTGKVTITLPLPAHASYSDAGAATALGTAVFNRALVSYNTLQFLSEGNAGTVTMMRYSGDPEVLVGVSSTLPATWTTGDVVAGTFTYEAA